MNYLDDIQHIIELDKSGMHKAIKDLPLQLDQTWKESCVIQLPPDYKDILNVVICGMGGSGLGAHTILSLYARKLMKPVEIIHEYHLPGYVGEKTLVMIISNTGNTEEEIACFYEAREKGAKILGITSGGHLQELLENKQLPGYIYDQKYNTTGLGRMSLGYVLLSVLAFLVHLEIITIDTTDVVQAIEGMSESGQLNGLEIPTAQNPAKKLAGELHYSIPFLIGAEFLGGMMHTMANQLNENAKKLSAYFLLSEMNHHLLEGLGFEQNKGAFAFVMFDSELYSKRIRQRLELSRTIIEKNNFRVYSHFVHGNTPISQVLNLLHFSSYISYYIGLLNNIDPAPIPWVNFLKKELDDFDAHTHE